MHYDDIIIYTTLEETTRTLQKAHALGTSSILVLFEKHDKANKDALMVLAAKVHGTVLSAGVLAKNAKDAQNLSSGYDIVAGVATREMIECKQAMLIFGAEAFEEKDKTHHRASGLNQVTARLLADKGKTYAFDLSLLLSARDRPLILGRMMQNKRFFARFKGGYGLYSFAREPLGVRSKRERAGFSELL